MSDLIPSELGGPVTTLADAETALKTIAVAEAAEKHWARAKDVTQLIKAVTVKLDAQAKYVIWRDSVVTPGPKMPGAGKGRGKKVPEPKSSKLPNADPGALVAHRWRKKLCEEANGRAVKKHPVNYEIALTKARQTCIRICEQENAGTVRGTEGTGEFERYTPAEFIEPAREVLGEIDLDPASCAKAQEAVKATKFFTVEDDGLSQEWHGRVFLNPPYHRELQPLFIDKLLAELDAGRTIEAIVLTNNSTETDWWQAAADYCNAVCFANTRIKFTDEHGEKLSPTQGQTFLYYGSRATEFVRRFAGEHGDDPSRIGLCMQPMDDPA